VAALSAPAGVDADRVTAWITERTDLAIAPITYSLIAGGRSNLTFRADDSAGHSWVLRRPPLGPVLATAHDMSREHRIIAALAPSGVPVPPTLGLCTDDSVNGAPFYVMTHVEGVVARDQATAETLTLDARATAGRDVVDVLARIHQLDIDAVGLGDLGRRDGYVARQLKRWRTQWDASKTRELPTIERVHEKLAASIPEQRHTGIVHGDYRLDNCIVGPHGHVRAVLDWELCTLGDTMADLGQMLVYWGQSGDATTALASPPTLARGFPDRDEVADRYSVASGRALDHLDYYVAFASWKVACILEGVYARYRTGAMGDTDGTDIDQFRDRVDMLADRAASILAASNSTSTNPTSG
jgi:aminoglycoside phosphotransferase (APT) family kinase protein